MADSGRMLGLAFRAWLVSLGLSLLVVLGLGLVAGLLLGVLTTRYSTGAVSGGFLTMSVVPTLVIVIALCQFWVGRWIARRAPGRELPACLAFALLQWILEWTVVIALGLATKDKELTITASGGLGYMLTHFSCFFGALTVRHRVRM
jgi:hypothetical protein